MPQSNDTLVVSAAADRDIYVHDVSKGVCVNAMRSHYGRVKRLATAPDQEHVFWSCGEDGLVLQHDLRQASANVLLNYATYRNDAARVEVKCIAVNEVRSEQLAVGGNDPYARVYDRRMLKVRPFVARGTSDTATHVPSKTRCLFEYCLEGTELCSSSNGGAGGGNDRLLAQPVRHYVPGHLPKRVDEFRKRMKTLSVTHLTFNAAGDELLVNLGGEQLYLFNVNNSASTSGSSAPFPDRMYKHDAFRDMFADVGTSEET